MGNERPLTLPADLMDPDVFGRTREQVEQAFGGLGILINNAGAAEQPGTGRSKPVIAAVEGSRSAVVRDRSGVRSDRGRNQCMIRTPEARRGVVPTCGGIVRVLETLPRGHGMGLLLAGDEIDGATAGRLGLVTRVAEDDEAVAVAHELAEGVCRSSPTSDSALAVRQIKASTTSARWAETAAAIAVDGSPYMREGIAAFFEHRAPQWDSDVAEDLD